MAQASISLFDNNVLHALAESSGHSQGEDAGYFAGKLTDAFEVEPEYGEGEGKRMWVACSARAGSVTVLVTYENASTDEFLVEPGYPLLFISKGGTPVVSVTATPSDTECDIEFLVHESDLPVSAEAEEQFLWLRADRDVGVNFGSDEVYTWQDTRSTTLYGALWTADSSGITLVDSDDEFNGEPVLLFDGASSLAGASVFGSYMNGRTSFTIWAVLKPIDEAPAAGTSRQQTILRTGAYTAQDAGGRLGIEGGYRPFFELYAESGGATKVVEGVNTEELVDKPTIICLRYDTDNNTVHMYRQGRWELIDSTNEGNSGVTTIPRIGGYTEDNATGNFLLDGTKLAELRVYPTAKSLEDIEELNAYAVDRYGIDDTWGQGFPWVGTAAMFVRAGRGVSTTDVYNGASVGTWWDTRTAESPTPGSAIIAGVNNPLLESNDGTLDRPAITFDGSAAYLTASSASSFWDALSGSTTGFTISMVFYETTGASLAYAIISQGSYGSTTMVGINVWLNDDFFFEVEDSTGAAVVLDNTTPFTPGTPIAMVYRASENSNIYRMELLDLSTGATLTVHGAFDDSGVSPGTAVTTTPRFFTWADTARFTAGGMGEFGFMEGFMGDEEVAEFFEYAQRYYVD